MSELRLDPLTGRWVVVSAERAERPHDLVSASTAAGDTGRPCPFCPGNEEATPPALETYGSEGKWLVRIVSNAYPAFSGMSPLTVSTRGSLFSSAPASGVHEVLVLSPDHYTGWADLPDNQVGLIVAALRDRMEEHSEVRALRYTQAVVNSGREAGASLDHPHGQLMGMPFVPTEITLEEAGFARFSGNCLLCATLDAEEAANLRIVASTDRVVVVCPYWSGSPFEMLVIPRTHAEHMYGADPADLAATARAIRDGLHALHKELGPVAYNLVFHSAPFRAASEYHWHVHVYPKVTTRGGYELGTGVLINILAPELAAQDLRRHL